MSNFKINRISEDIKRNLVGIISELKDPRINKSIISILRIDLTNDLSYATIYITSLDGINVAKEAVEGLTNAKGFIKRELSKSLEIRKMPELIFKASDSIEYSSYINETLKEL